MTALTTSQAAERLEVPLSTLKAWLDRLDLPLPVDSRGRRMLDAHALSVIERVRGLREHDNGYETIRRVLSDEGVGEPSRANTPTVSPFVPELIGIQVKAALHEVMGEHNFVAQAYAEAARELGKCEERVAFLEARLTDKEAEITGLRHALALARGEEPAFESTEPATTRPAWKFW